MCSLADHFFAKQQAQTLTLDEQGTNKVLLLDGEHQMHVAKLVGNGKRLQYMTRDWCLFHCMPYSRQSGHGDKEDQSN